MSQTIELLISPTGAVRLQTKGFRGESCQAASRELEAAIGQTINDQRTAEYFQAELSALGQEQRP
jgi:hypothetical protein